MYQILTILSHSLALKGTESTELPRLAMSLLQSHPNYRCVIVAFWRSKMQAAASTLSPASIHKEQVVAENAWKGLHLCRLHVDVCTMVRERSMPGPKNFTFLYYDVLGTLRSYNAQTV